MVIVGIALVIQLIWNLIDHGSIHDKVGPGDCDVCRGHGWYFGNTIGDRNVCWKCRGSGKVKS
jgi:DnaJ-class molecular chaperone